MLTLDWARKRCSGLTEAVSLNPRARSVARQGKIDDQRRRRRQETALADRCGSLEAVSVVKKICAGVDRGSVSVGCTDSGKKNAKH